MDCFYAAIEMRDFPDLANKAIAVGGDAKRRGVIATCNYLAREFGIRSAMPTAHALKLYLFVKLKFNDFQQTTVERMSDKVDLVVLQQLIHEGFSRKSMPVRLLGIGIKLIQENVQTSTQLPLFSL